MRNHSDAHASYFASMIKGVDGRTKPGHDEESVSTIPTVAITPQYARARPRVLGPKILASKHA